MAKAKKLPSGSWRCQAYSHSEPVYDRGKPVMDAKTGKQKQRRVYVSFTSDTPGSKGKREAELMAAAFQADKDNPKPIKSSNYGDMTLSQAIDRYIESREVLSRSPTTIQEYRCTQKYAFPSLMDRQLKDIDAELLQESINKESQRKAGGRNRERTISAKRLKNEWGLISAVLKKYRPDLSYSVELPAVRQRIPDILPAETVLKIIRGTEIELAVLLAAWLSFSMSELLGLTKSKSISGDNIRIEEVVVSVDGGTIRKDTGKNQYRNRTHHIPPYIKGLIDKVEGDVLVPLGSRSLYYRWIKLLDDNLLPHMTFHDLRHLNASIMALLQIPDKYAQERGGWATDQVMKRVYTQTFPAERQKVDAVIDTYFDNLISGDDNFDRNKYQAWLTLFDKRDNRQSKKEFLMFMQHDISHESKKVPEIRHLYQAGDGNRTHVSSLEG